jgi:predicted transcriptional regulator
MTRTQIQLPDELYKRARRMAARRELSLAEMTRRGLELFLARFPDAAATDTAWRMPKVNAGGLKVPIGRLRDIAADDESTRSLRKR